MQKTCYMRPIFQIVGRNVNGERANPLIAKFRKALEELKVNQGSVSATIYTVDDFAVWQKNQDLYEGRYLVRWEISDNEVGWESRMNHETKALLMRALLAIKFSHYKMEIKTIRVLDGSNE